MDLERVRLCDAAEGAAFGSLCAAAPAGFAEAVGLKTMELAGATVLMAPGIPLALFNRVIGLGNDGPVADGIISEIVGFYRSAGVKSWWIHAGPAAGGLDDQLLRLGFTRPERSTWAKMWRRPEILAVPDCSYDVRAVRAGEEPVVAEAIAAGFGMPAPFVGWLTAHMQAPGWRGFGAFDSETAVGGGMLFMDGDIAWLGVGGVRPEARQRGAQRALMALRINAAVAAGAAHIATETGEPVGDEPNPSLRNMYACGFEKECSRENFAGPV